METEIRYNVTGDRRKALVQAIADITGARPVYKFMPTCNYEVGCFTVTKDGTLIFDDRTDSVEAEKVLDGIAAAGFECEAPQGADSVDTAAPDGLTVNLPMDGFGTDALERLRKLVDSKASLIKKALGAERLTILPDGDKVLRTL